MCGAIAASSSRHGKFRDVAIYHLTRIVSYGLIGFLLGLIAASLLSGFPWLQRVHSRYVGLMLGVLMLLYAASEIAKLLGWFQAKTRAHPWFQRLSRRLPLSEPMILGIATALLPCGFLYAAFLQAAVLANPVYSSAGMLLFGVATGPALGFGGAVFLWFQKRSPRLAPWISALALLIAGLAIVLRSLPHQHGMHPAEQTSGPEAPHH